MYLVALLMLQQSLSAIGVMNTLKYLLPRKRYVRVEESSH